MPSIIANHEIVLLCSHAFKCYDTRLMDHGTRVAFIAQQIYSKLNIELDEEKIFLLSLFHDIGAYKTEEIDRMVTFETVDVDAHSIYGYLFLKYLSPLAEHAKAILYHHAPLEILRNVDPTIATYAQLIHIADRADIGILGGFKGEQLIKNVMGTGYFDQNFTDALSQAVDENLFDDFPFCVESWAREKSKALNLSGEEIDSYLEMIIYSMDFKSNTTMVHSVNTTTVAVFLAQHLGFSSREIERIYYGSLVHDIGKIAIPEHILESKDKLKKDEMDIMRSHAQLTRTMLVGIFEPTIIDYAAAHHEKLNGTGYPNGLNDEQLSMPMRIIAVADIVSALLGNRSYKTAYGWDKTITILEDMSRQFLIDDSLVQIVIQNRDELQQQLEQKSNPVVEVYDQIHREFQHLIKSDKNKI